MKRILKKYKPIIKIVLLLAAAITAYILAHKAGTSERGYEAIGGEIFLPFVVFFAEDIWDIIKAPFKAVDFEDAN